MKKSIIYIFISLFSVLLMSHNTFAFTISQNVDIVQTVNQPQVSFYNGTSWSNYQRGYLSFNSSSGNFIEMRLLKTDFTSIDSFKKNDYIIINGFFIANQIFSSEMKEPFVVGGYIGSDGRAVNCSITDLQFGAVQEYIQGQDVYYRADFSMTCQITNANVVNNNLTINFRLKPDILPVSGTKLDISFNAAMLATPSSDINQEQKQETQNAANNSATSGNTSKTDSQNATSSLLSVITSGIGAITSASPTNCKINGNMGNLNVGNIDLCANPVPTFMTIIGSIIAVLVVLPLVILLFNRFISIIRSFQR